MPTTETRTWICPTGCGCEIDLSATWGPIPPDADGTGRRVSFRHPLPGTIRSARASAACAVHAPLLSAPLPKDPFGDAPGYMAVPADPTDGERLYLHLCRYALTLQKLDTCDCVIAQVSDRLGASARSVTRDVRERKCAHHGADVTGAAALGDNAMKNAVMAIADGRSIPAAWSFDGARTLRIAVQLTGGQLNAAKAALLADIASTPYAARVLLE